MVLSIDLQFQPFLMNSLEKMMHLKKLSYKKSNLPNVSVFYGEDEKAICVKKKASAYISKGKIEIFCVQPEENLHYEINVREDAEIKNETNSLIFIQLGNNMLLPSKTGDLIFTIRNGIEERIKNET